MSKSRPLTVMLAAVVGLVSLATHSSSQGPPAQTIVIDKNTYDLRDIGPFAPSGAIYFMDGSSEATVRVYATGQTMTFSFTDQSTSIAASAPTSFNSNLQKSGVFVPVPPPLRPVAHYPLNTPDRYERNTALHMMQVVSMNMRDPKSGSGLLIGMPYAEKYPEIFFDSKLFPAGARDASSFGVVQSLMETRGGGQEEIRNTGYPARSFFGIYHILETPMGTFFNKKATQMELQPDRNGKLALTLPPIPFSYTLLNGPIPLFDVKNPNGKPVAEIVAAHHESSREARSFSPDSWPARNPNLRRIEGVIQRLNRRK